MDIKTHKMLRSCIEDKLKDYIDGHQVFRSCVENKLNEHIKKHRDDRNVYLDLDSIIVDVIASSMDLATHLHRGDLKNLIYVCGLISYCIGDILESAIELMNYPSFNNKK